VVVVADRLGHPEKGADVDLEARLLPDLTGDGLAQRLAAADLAPGQRPAARSRGLAAQDDEKTAVTVEDHRPDSDRWPVRWPVHERLAYGRDGRGTAEETTVPYDETFLDDLKRTTREFCDRELRPTARDRDREERFPSELLPALAEVGFLGATFPDELGGMELDPHGYAVVMEELGASDSAIRSTVSVNVGLVGGSIMRWGTDEQQKAWLPRLARGELGAFGLTEPEAGSNPGQMTTRARRDGDDWVIDGAKVFISNGTVGAVTMVFARAVDGETDAGITCFLVPQDSDGYEAQQMHGKLGLRGGDTAEISLRGVRVPADTVLGEVGGGMKVALSALDDGRFSLASACVGVAREALEVSVRYAKEREQFGQPIASFQLVQAMLADSHVDVEAGRALVRRVAEKKEAGGRYTVESSTAKYFCTEAAVRCADRAVQIHGGYGYVDEYPVQRLLRDARVTTLYEGTSQVHQLLLGRHLTGIDAFR
jgi:alkylation response protein AidB-like acyl-CoA dehydrogenase